MDFAVPCIETELDPEAVPSKDIELLPEAVPVKAIELDPDAVPETKAILFAPEANVPFTPWANELTPPAVASPPECEFFPFA